MDNMKENRIGVFYEELQKIHMDANGFILMYFFYLFRSDLLVKFQASNQASQFLKHAANQDFEKAFDRIYYFNGAYE
jgi:hypothetical protein